MPYLTILKLVGSLVNLVIENLVNLLRPLLLLLIHLGLDFFACSICEQTLNHAEIFTEAPQSVLQLPQLILPPGPPSHIPLLAVTKRSIAPVLAPDALLMFNFIRVFSTFERRLNLRRRLINHWLIYHKSSIDELQSGSYLFFLWCWLF